ncbi:hypothetical protein BKA61DRAFT_54382 [Leptodontidium sp. MPI-SDFR-AT-0119]|nr:hypothetical protein BKA61DRAFT_54382 [Leptodontidium sp. MPI-SDFR-AT-0119]
MADVQGQLFQKTQSCRDVLMRGATGHIMENDTEVEWFENRLADLNLWAAGLGASKIGHASLEYRLRDRSDVCEVIQGLLEELHDALSELERRTDVVSEVSLIDPDSNSAKIGAQNFEDSASVSPSPIEPLSPPSDLSEDEDESRTLLTESKRNVEMTLDQLARLSVLIRKSGSRFRHQKADRTLNFQSLPQELQILRDGLTEVVLLYQDGPERRLVDGLRQGVFQKRISLSILIVIRAWFLNPARLTSIQERLIRANIRRRNRFAYAYDRAKEDRTDFQVPPEQFPATPERPIPEKEVPQPVDAPSTAPISTSTPKPESRNDDTSKSATDLGSKFTLKKIRGSATMSVDTRMSATAATLDYPQPPRVEPDRRTFQCPYCQHTLPRDYIASTARRWKYVTISLEVRDNQRKGLGSHVRTFFQSL